MNHTSVRILRHPLLEGTGVFFWHRVLFALLPIEEEDCFNRLFGDHLPGSWAFLLSEVPSPSSSAPLLLGAGAQSPGWRKSRRSAFLEAEQKDCNSLLGDGAANLRRRRVMGISWPGMWRNTRLWSSALF